jgi:tetratricopeptide (TPR) repeat protein
MKRQYVAASCVVYFFCIALTLCFISNASAEPLEICLVAEKEQDPNKQIELFTDCIRIEFQRITQNNISNINNLSVGYLGRGLAYCKIGKFSLAKEDFNTSIHLNPSISISYKYRGLLFKQLKEYENAISDFDMAINHADDAELLIERGSTYGEMGKYQLALDDFEKAKRIHHQNSLLYHLSGYYYCKIKMDEKAVENFKRSLELKPNDPSTLSNFAHCMLTANSSKVRDNQGALKMAKTAAEITDNKDSSILVTLAAAYATNGDFEEAVEKQILALQHVGSNENDVVSELEEALNSYKNGELYYHNKE